MTIAIWIKDFFIGYSGHGQNKGYMGLRQLWIIEILG